MLELPSTAKMPTDQDQYDVSIDLVTMAGTEYTTQTNLTHYENILQLEDDILCFLPTVSDIDVFGCELDLIEFDTQLPLPEAFHAALIQQRKLQIVVRPCMVEGHSIWQFQEGDRESYPKAIRVLVNPRREIADRAFYAAPMLRHVEIAAGIQHVGFAAWQGCRHDVGVALLRTPLLGLLPLDSWGRGQQAGCCGWDTLLGVPARVGLRCNP